MFSSVTGKITKLGRVAQGLDVPATQITYAGGGQGAWLRLADQKAPHVIFNETLWNQTRVKECNEPSGIYRGLGQRSHQGSSPPQSSKYSANTEAAAG